MYDPLGEHLSGRAPAWSEQRDLHEPPWRDPPWRDAPVTAHFRGGPLDGRIEALPPDAPRVYQVPQPPQVYWTDYSTPLQIGTVDYYASGRTIHAARDLVTGANNYTISIEYTVSATTAATGTAALSYPQYPALTGTQNSPHWYNANPVPMTEEERAARAAQTARTALRERRKKARIQKRARKLLLGLLTEEQQHEYARSKAFTVVARNGKTFRLRKDKTAELLGTDGAAIAAYCIHLPYGYPAEDTLAALMLLLKADPEVFEKTANVTRLQPSTSTVAADVRRMGASMEEAGRAARYAAEHMREARAMLRSEGLSEAEIESLRQWPNRQSGLLAVGGAA